MWLDDVCDGCGAQLGAVGCESFRCATNVAGVVASAIDDLPPEEARALLLEIARDLADGGDARVPVAQIRTIARELRARAAGALSGIFTVYANWLDRIASQEQRP